MADETRPTPSGDAPASSGERPAASGGGERRPYRPAGGPGGPREGGGGGRKFFPRKKVCKFCTEKIEAINYKDVPPLPPFVAATPNIPPPPLPPPSPPP